MLMCCNRASERCSLAAERGHLDHDRPVRQRELRGQEDLAQRPPAELGQEPELRPGPRLDVGQRAGIGPGSISAGSRGAISRSGHQPGEPPGEVGRVDLEAGLLAEAVFLEDQPDRRLVAEVRVARQEFLGQGPLAAIARRPPSPRPGGRRRARSGVESVEGVHRALQPASPILQRGAGPVREPGRGRPLRRPGAWPVRR